jgi:multicomponent Na+:H+ antiporter subunit C
MVGLAAMQVGVLCACGLYLMLSQNVQRLVIGFLLFSNGVNLLVLASGGLPARAAPPLLHDGAAGPFADPLPQAFILTAIVIGLGMAAFLLAMAVRFHARTRRDVLSRSDEA